MPPLQSARKPRPNGKAGGDEIKPGRMRLSSLSETGFLLLSATLQPLYLNPFAAEILLHPDKPNGTRDFSKRLDARIRAIITNGTPGKLSVCEEFVSGRRHYICRLFDVHMPGKKSDGSSLALLLERGGGSAAGAAQICHQYHLSPREAQAVRFLALGLASKEIAARMGISPHTVKVFLRFAMVKMGVSSRAGIMSKFITARCESV